MSEILKFISNFYFYLTTTVSKNLKRCGYFFLLHFTDSAHIRPQLNVPHPNGFFAIITGLAGGLVIAGEVLKIDRIKLLLVLLLS